MVKTLHSSGGKKSHTLGPSWKNGDNISGSVLALQTDVEKSICFCKF